MLMTDCDEIKEKIRKKVESITTSWAYVEVLDRWEGEDVILPQSPMEMYKLIDDLEDLRDAIIVAKLYNCDVK